MLITDFMTPTKNQEEVPQLSAEELRRFREFLEESRNRTMFNSTMLETPKADQTLNEMSAKFTDKMTVFKPCVEKDAPDKITKREYTAYKRAFEHQASLLTNKDKMSLYATMKHTAGKQFMNLLDTLDLKESAANAEDPVKEIFAIMDNYFNDESEFVNARIAFHNIKQKKDEKHLQFLNRVILEGKKCNYNSDEIEREVISLIQIRSTNELIRHQAGAFESSVEKIRHTAKTADVDEAFWKRDEEKEKSAKLNHVVRRKRNNENSPTVSSESDDGQDTRLFQFQDKRARYGNNSNRNFFDNDRFPRSNSGRYQPDNKYRRCNRCNGNGHDENSCYSRNVTCDNCNKVGHLRRACRYLNNSSNQSRTSSSRGNSGRHDSRDLHQSRRSPKRESDGKAGSSGKRVQSDRKRDEIDSKSHAKVLSVSEVRDKNKLKGESSSESS